jgi:hypothetical protein
MNLLHCSLLNDLISNDNPISDVIVYVVAESILCLWVKSGPRGKQCGIRNVRPVQGDRYRSH